MVNTEEVIIPNKVKNEDVPLEHLDYKYVEKCENVKELEKIYKILASGVEGRYPDLENFVFNKIKEKSPNSRVLRKDLPIQSKDSIPKSEKDLLDQEINSFVDKAPSLEKKNNFEKQNENLPPIRQSTVLNPNKSTKPTNSQQFEKKKTNPMPKDFSQWSKIEKELENELETNETSEVKTVNDSTSINDGNSIKKQVKNLPTKVETEELSEELKEKRADQEKCKGNESFNAGSYEEALVYYTRSLEYFPNAASFNNRAMTYLKLEKWEKAIEDCDQVLKNETNNVKALLRRATGFFKVKSFQKAKDDIEKCLSLEPKNKKAAELKTQIESSFKKENEVKSSVGNRIKIEDTDGSDAESDEELKKKKSERKATTKNETNKKTSIKIAEESGSESEEEKNKSKQNKNKVESKTNLNGSNATIGSTNTNASTNSTNAKVGLPGNILKLKDQANTRFKNGQYGDANEFYTKAIDALKKIISSSNTEQFTEQYSLSVLYSNRASCSQKICDYKLCIKDCDLALDLLKILDKGAELSPNDNFKSLRVKLISKKANSFEMLEKYADAYLEYECLMKFDSTFPNVQQSYNRVKNILNQTGELEKIRNAKKTSQETEKTKETIKTTTQEKTVTQEAKKENETPKFENVTNLPKENKSTETVKENNKAETKKTTEVFNKEETKVSKENEEKIIEVKKEEKEDTLKRKYEELKKKGNESVSQGDLISAIEHYTDCIKLDPVNTVAYLNRSYCYLSLNRADMVLEDTNFVLNKDKNNVKALYRRASAFKMKAFWDSATKDLKRLLDIEPNNQTAKKEYDELINERDKLKKKKTLIELIDPDYNKPPPPKKTKEQKEKEKKEQAQRELEKKKKETEKAKQLKKDAPPEVIPTYDFSNIKNSYEFLQAWNSIGSNDMENYMNLISSVEPIDLPKLLGSNLDDTMLSKLIRAIYKLNFTKKKIKNKNKVVNYLRHLGKTDRFSVVRMFIDNEDEGYIEEMLDSKEVAPFAEEIKISYGLVKW